MPKTLFLLALLSLAGCQLAPTHERPASPSAEAFPYAAEGAADPLAIGWREFFADPRLEAYLEAALTRNRDLRAAVLRIEEARGLARARGAERLPSLGATAEATRSHFGPGATVGSGGSGVATGGGGTVERFSLGLAITAFELDFWGRVRNLAEAAREQYLQTIEAQRAFRLSLIDEVATTYLALLGIEARIDLAQATQESRTQALEIAKVRLDAGITSALDYRQSQALLTQAATELAALKLARAEQENYLVLLVGGPLPGVLPEPRPLTEQIAVGALDAGLPARLLLARPDILAAEARLRAARANVGVARAAFFPQISLTGSFGYASTELGGLVSGSNEFWSVGPNLVLPLFDWGRNEGNLTVAEARENLAVVEYERAIETAFREVADALAGRRYLDEQLARQQENVETLAAIAELARDRYEEGAVGYLEVLDAERELFAARQALIQALRAQVQNLVQLYVALGGGLPPALQAPSSGARTPGTVD